jgi:hypothetical protein
MKTNELKKFINEKKNIYTNILQDINKSIQLYKNLDIKNIKDLNSCLTNLESINYFLINLKNNKNIINDLQKINDLCYNIIKKYGCYKFKYLIQIIFGNNFKVDDYEIYELLKKYFHPISFKIIKNDKNIKIKNKIEFCFKNINDTKNFYEKINGIELSIINNNRIIVINGILENIYIDLINNSYITNKMSKLKNILQDEIPINKEKNNYKNFIEILNLKDLLIYNNQEIINLYQTFLNDLKNIKEISISKLINDYNKKDLYEKRMCVLKLLIDFNNPENSYLAYLLYDLLSEDNRDSLEQTKIYDSFNWKVKKIFKNSMNITNEYNKRIVNIVEDDIPIEQRICLMKAPDNVKEKAMMKYKEFKSKSEETGSKTRQYLEGLLKVPFGIYKKEPILKIVGENIIRIT